MQAKNKNRKNLSLRKSNPDIRKIVNGRPVELWSEGLNSKQRNEGWIFGVPAGEDAKQAGV